MLAAMALVTALTAVATAYLGVDLPYGYYHLGDGVYLAAALAFGPLVGAVAGGLGGAIADLISGYAVWAPFTLVIKGLAGAAAGWMAGRAVAWRRQVPGLVAAGLLTVAGYFAASVRLYGPAAAAAELWGTAAQVVVGAGIALVLAPMLRRAAGAR